eukprot:COSAG05_NODE_186_length_14726_cov_28.333630_1_plen_260_part_10
MLLANLGVSGLARQPRVSGLANQPRVSGLANLPRLWRAKLAERYAQIGTSFAEVEHRTVEALRELTIAANSKIVDMHVFGTPTRKMMQRQQPPIQPLRPLYLSHPSCTLHNRSRRGFGGDRNMHDQVYTNLRRLADHAAPACTYFRDLPEGSGGDRTFSLEECSLGGNNVCGCQLLYRECLSQHICVRVYLGVGERSIEAKQSRPAKTQRFVKTLTRDAKNEHEEDSSLGGNNVCGCQLLYRECLSQHICVRVYLGVGER